MEAKDASEMRLARLRRFGRCDERDYQMYSKDDGKDDGKDRMDTKDGMQ